MVAARSWDDGRDEQDVTGRHRAGEAQPDGQQPGEDRRGIRPHAEGVLRKDAGLMHVPATLLEQHPGACYNARQSVPRLSRAASVTSGAGLPCRGDRLFHFQRRPSLILPRQADDSDDHQQQLAHGYDCLCVHELLLSDAAQDMTEHRRRFYHGRFPSRARARALFAVKDRSEGGEVPSRTGSV